MFLKKSNFMLGLLFSRK